VRAPAAAGSVLELDDAVQWLSLCFFIPWKVFAFAVVLVFRQAAMRCLTAVSALIPIAQMKPNSSRPTAVTILR
jgi:hypothetical protein